MFGMTDKSFWPFGGFRSRLGIKQDGFLHVKIETFSFNIIWRLTVERTTKMPTTRHSLQVRDIWIISKTSDWVENGQNKMKVLSDVNTALWSVKVREHLSLLFSRQRLQMIDSVGPEYMIRLNQRWYNVDPRRGRWINIIQTCFQSFACRAYCGKGA